MSGTRQEEFSPRQLISSCFTCLFSLFKPLKVLGFVPLSQELANKLAQPQLAAAAGAELPPPGVMLCRQLGEFCVSGNVSLG